MFRRSRKDPPSAPSPRTAEAGGAPCAEEAADALAEALRTWGQLSFDLEGLEASALHELFEGWARHVLVAAPPPGRPEATEGVRRDWALLQHFLRDQRESERDFVERSLSDLRHVIAVFVQSLGRAVSEDRAADCSMHEQLERLREAAHSSDTTTLKREALHSIQLIENVITRRTERQRSQMVELSHRVERMKVELLEVREQLGTDALTKIYNRAAFDEHVARVLDFATVLGSPAVAFMIDVDHFKWVNDRYGHSAGDHVLQHVAHALATAFRRKGDFVARYGGDEFVALIQDGSLEVAQTIGERLLFAIRDLEVKQAEGDPIRVSVSIGAARLVPGEDLKTWMDRADRALYVAKELGRDRVVVDTEAEARAGTVPGAANGPGDA